MRVQISSELLGSIRADAAAHPRVEVCGLLVGYAGKVAGIVPASNVALEPERAFEIDPAVLLAVHRRTRAGGARIIGCYHSHPNGSCEPSERDLASAEIGQVWLITAAGQVAAYRKVARAFAPIGIVVTPRGLRPAGPVVHRT